VIGAAVHAQLIRIGQWHDASFNLGGRKGGIDPIKVVA
jgi:hypothetical protein